MRKRLTFNDRAEWLTARKDGIGASEVATVVGLNPWETPYQLWRRKVGLDAPKQENFAMKAGHYLEDAVAQFWADETGNEIIKASVEDFMFIDETKPYLRVSPDRTYWLKGTPKNDDNKGILECKTTQMSIDAEDLPKRWFVQVQMNLGVAGYQYGSLAWLTAGREFGYKDLAFVPDFYAWLVEEVDRFWIDNIQGKQEPTAANVQDILLKYNRHTDGKIIEATTDIVTAYNQLKGVRTEISKLEATKEELEARIKIGFGDAEAMSYDGQTLATWKAAKDSSKFDAKLFCKENPELAEKYTITQPGSRRFLLK